VELHEESAIAALALLRSEGHDARIHVGDFFEVEPVPRFDAVIGNPPYVRYQDFTGEPRALGRAAALGIFCRPAGPGVSLIC
jgi:adenine-specific DNA-methyltransferase